MRWNVKHLIHGHSTTDQNHHPKSCCSHFSYLKRSNFLKVLLHLWSHWELKILMRPLKASVIIPILEKLVGGYSTPHCVTVIGHRTWGWLCCFPRLGIIVCVCLVAQLSNFCDPMNWSPPGSSVHQGLLSKRIQGESPYTLPFISVSNLAVPVKTGAKMTKGDSEA